MYCHVSTHAHSQMQEVDSKAAHYYAEVGTCTSYNMDSLVLMLSPANVQRATFASIVALVQSRYMHVRGRVWGQGYNTDVCVHHLSVSLLL